MKKNIYFIAFVMTMLTSFNVEAQHDKKFGLVNFYCNDKICLHFINADLGMGAFPSKIKFWNAEPELTSDATKDIWLIKIGPFSAAWGLDYVLTGENVLGYQVIETYTYNRYTLDFVHLSWNMNNFWLSQTFSIGMFHEKYRRTRTDTSDNHVGWTQNQILNAQDFARTGNVEALGIHLGYRIGIVSFEAEFSKIGRSYHVVLVYPIFAHPHLMKDLFL